MPSYAKSFDKLTIDLFFVSNYELLDHHFAEFYEWNWSVICTSPVWVAQKIDQHNSEDQIKQLATSSYRNMLLSGKNLQPLSRVTAATKIWKPRAFSHRNSCQIVSSQPFTVLMFSFSPLYHCLFNLLSCSNYHHPHRQSENFIATYSTKPLLCFSIIV